MEDILTLHALPGFLHLRGGGVLGSNGKLTGLDHLNTGFHGAGVPCQGRACHKEHAHTQSQGAQHQRPGGVAGIRCLLILGSILALIAAFMKQFPNIWKKTKKNTKMSFILQMM